MVDVIKFLKFEDWLKLKDKDGNWTTVAQARKFRENGLDNDFFTISIITDKIDLQNLVGYYNWFSQVEFGNPSVWTEGDELRYYPNDFTEEGRLRFEPFIIYRSWHKRSLNFKFSIIQDFILFYNLYFDPMTRILKAIAETGEEFEVIKMNQNREEKRIEINTKFLKNYLSIKNKILIRQHDLTRFTSESLKSLIDKKSEDLSFIGDDFNYRLTMAEQPCSSYTSFSRLLGKDLILPYEEGKALLEWEKKYENFIIGVDVEGKDIEITCDENKLSNFFKNRDTPHFLTPVYFKKDVLKKYYDNQSKYSVSSTSVNCSGLWLIHIDEYKDLIQVWLGDLGHIPYNEQQHWKQFNVVSDGKITASRFKRDFMAEFCDPEDLMYRFHKESDVFQKKFEKTFGFTLFIPLKHEDNYICETLRIPLNNEQPEFDLQLNNLAKILPDSIDIKNIKKQLIDSGMSEEDLEEIKDKKIRCLEVFLEKNKLENNFVQILDLIQNIRSKCIAHRRGDNCIKLLKSYGLNEKTNIEIFKVVFRDNSNNMVSFQTR